MGTKFANFHLKTTDEAALDEVLRHLSAAAVSKLSSFADAGPEPSFLERVIRQNGNELTADFPKINLPSVSFYVNHGERWSSVLNDHLAWGIVEEVGEIASNFTDQPVMTIGFFDEDVFEFTLFEAGEIKVKKYFCGSGVREDYGLESERADAEYTARTLETDLESVENWFAIDNPEAAIDELSRLTGVHFWIHSAWIDDDPEIEEVYAKRVYKLQR
ncbi:hypothetical protein QWJ34_12285 [Saccharibacillus sp. CPCC 101409]|uniref:hypothetical protein n=1 Tax=Saccharibacillus sp. CPCC 101409 TaxID=3058041 RepID=UPI002673070B|nr:hypothetical protein [Saccharibacillus sp. CPCC 101409]MDO3410541.1 hypothetical protein [Saccharibacillus sp. CPCC 101409]